MAGYACSYRCLLLVYDLLIGEILMSREKPEMLGKGLGKAGLMLLVDLKQTKLTFEAYDILFLESERNGR